MLSGSGANEPWQERQFAFAAREWGRSSAAGVVDLWQSRHWSAWMPECPAAVATSRSFAVTRRAAPPALQGWPIGGTGTLPTPPPAVVWQAMQSSPTGI